MVQRGLQLTFEFDPGRRQYAVSIVEYDKRRSATALYEGSGIIANSALPLQLVHRVSSSCANRPVRAESAMIIGRGSACSASLEAGRSPVQFPTKFEMVVNRKTAKALVSPYPHRFCCALTR
jgi:hypothetical protein